MAWNVYVLAQAVATLVLMRAHVGVTHDDVALEFCRIVCWDEVTLGEQCEITRNCDSSELSKAARNRCSNRCYRSSTRCWGFCRRNFEQILQACRPQCTSLSSYEFCLMDCFVNRALTMKNRNRRNGQNRRNLHPPTPPGEAILSPQGENTPPPPARNSTLSEGEKEE